MLPHFRFDKPAVVTRKIAGLFACFFCLTAIAQNARESAPTKAPQTRPVLTYHNWHGIDEATVFQPFKGSDYDTIAVENFDINGVRLPPAKENTIHAVEQALSDMKPEFIAGLTKNARRPVGGQQSGKTLVVRARLAKLDPGSQGGLLFESGTVQIRIIGELIDGSSGQLLVRFSQERQSGFRVFGGRSDELFRQTARQLGGDVATLINSFTP